MSATIWFLIAALSLVVIVWALSKKPSDAFAVAEEKRPASLRNAIVVEPRTPLAMTVPFALHGTPDLIYQTRERTLIVREDKSGFRNVIAERIQLSVYAAILRHNPPTALRGMQVEPYGWVRHGIPGQSQVKWECVSLLSDAELAELIDRYRSIRSGQPARKIKSDGYCRKVCQQFGSHCDGPARVPLKSA